MPVSFLDLRSTTLGSSSFSLPASFSLPTVLLPPWSLSTRGSALLARSEEWGPAVLPVVLMSAFSDMLAVGSIILFSRSVPVVGLLLEEPTRPSQLLVYSGLVVVASLFCCVMTAGKLASRCGGPCQKHQHHLILSLWHRFRYL